MTPAERSRRRRYAVQYLEDELQTAFARCEFTRLYAFAYYCVDQVIGPQPPGSWRPVMALLRERGERTMELREFARRAGQLQARPELGGLNIGLRRGDPRAARLLTMAASLEATPLSAALLTSRHQRLYEAFLAARNAGEDGGIAGPIVLSLDPPEIRGGGRGPKEAAAKCAQVQLVAWQSIPRNRTRETGCASQSEA